MSSPLPVQTAGQWKTTAVPHRPHKVCHMFPIPNLTWYEEVRTASSSGDSGEYRGGLT